MRIIETGDIRFERKRFWLSMSIPTILLFVLWFLAFLQYQFGLNINQYGIIPQTTKGLIGIITSPFLHADFKHLWSNTIPLWILMTALFYYYPRVAWQTLAIIWIGEGLFVWLFAREGNHIGASGIVYGLAAFHFVQGILQHNSSLLAFMFLEIFLFGGMIWGIFPEFFPEKNISWESHLFGLIIGVILAFAFKHYGPPVVLQSWEIDPEEEQNNVDDTTDLTSKEQHEEIKSEENNSLETTRIENKLEKANDLRLNVRYIYHKNRDIKE